MKTQRETVKEEIASLLRARNPLIWIQNTEEVRVERTILEAAAAAKRETIFWDCATGFTDAVGAPIAEKIDPLAALRDIRAAKGRKVYVLRDLHRWLGQPTVCRMIRTLARELQSAPASDSRAVVVLSPATEIPPDIAPHAVVVEFPLPDREEIGEILDTAIRAQNERRKDKGLAPIKINGTRDDAIDAAVGLAAEQIASCYARSIVRHGAVDPATVYAEKRRVIAAERVLQWYDPDPRGLEAVGGLEELKSWLNSRKVAFSPEAREYGLEPPRGVMLVGIPGCGKSLTAKAVATAWGLPLLRLDIGALRSKWVGESEANIRRALAVAETVSPCIVWIDEIEKALAGATGQQGDGGVSADALGTILSWMQERRGSVFVIATANDVSVLPPELLRKGRFDELFFIDLPTATEREAILRAAVQKHCSKQQPKIKYNSEELLARTQGFTGAELDALVPDAMFRAFADSKRTLMTKDLLAVARTVAPLSETAGERITALRRWAKGRARPASAIEAHGAGTVGSTELDIDE